MFGSEGQISEEGESNQVRGAEEADFSWAAWRKSSWSAANGHCLEIAELPGSDIGVRQSQDSARGRPVLVFTREEWDTFISGVRANDFDLA